MQGGVPSTRGLPLGRRLQKGKACTLVTPRGTLPHGFARMGDGMQRIGRRAVMGLGLSGLAMGPAGAQAPAELRIGGLFPVSGPLGFLGDESFRGLELAVEERHAAGGLFGRPLRLLRTDAPDEMTAATEARRLLAGNDRVAALFGSFSSAIALPASQAAELAGVPFFELAALADAVMDRGFRFLFRASPRAADFAETSIEAVTGLLAPAFGQAADRLKLAIAHEEAAGGQSIANAQEALIRAQGLRLVERVAYASRAADLGAVVQRLRGLEADIVLHAGAPGDEVLLFRALREAGWRPRMVIGTAGGYGVTENARSLGDAFLGAMSADFTPFAVHERHAPGAPAFAETYLRRYGAEPRSGHSLAAFVGARWFLEALARAGSMERDRVRAAVLALDVPEGGSATGWGARFDERGQNTRAKPMLCQWQATAQGPRQMVVAPTAAAVAELVPRLGL
jgi:branched-chain amino acid transport system substrate-binding protein